MYVEAEKHHPLKIGENCKECNGIHGCAAASRKLFDDVRDKMGKFLDDCESGK